MNSPGARRLLGVLLMAAVIIYAGLQWRNRDVNRISRRLERLASAFSKSGNESTLAALRRAQEITLAFVAQPDIRLGPYLPQLSGREDIAAAVHRAHLTLTSIRASIRDKVIRVAADRQTAVTDVAVECAYSYQGSEDSRLTECRLSWIKENGKWMIQSFEPQEVIKPPRRIMKEY